jgi:hypothetical protein
VEGVECRLGVGLGREIDADRVVAPVVYPASAARASATSRTGSSISSDAPSTTTQVSPPWVRLSRSGGNGGRAIVVVTASVVLDVVGGRVVDTSVVDVVGSGSAELVVAIGTEVVASAAESSLLGWPSRHAVTASRATRAANSARFKVVSP